MQLAFPQIFAPRDFAVCAWSHSRLDVNDKNRTGEILQQGLSLPLNLSMKGIAIFDLTRTACQSWSRRVHGQDVAVGTTGRRIRPPCRSVLHLGIPEKLGVVWDHSPS